MIDDVLIIGSGASAVHAAYPLVQGGLAVRLLDMGHEDQTYAPLIPSESFLEIRKKDQQQHRYFLGDRFEGIPLGALNVGPQLTPPRQYITKGAPELTPVESKTFHPFASLALGGMASGWSAGAMGHCREEIEDFPISVEDLAPHYEAVAERIGVSGEVDDLYPFDGELKAMMPPLRIDRNASTILDRYEKRRSELNASGFHMGKTRLAALSQKHRGRGPDRYLDMAFWGDADQSVWRPRYTLNELRSFKNFAYQRPVLVGNFTELSDGTVEVSARNMETGWTETHRGRKLVLAAGTLGTARLVLRSMNQYDVRVPFVCNPYTYYPMVNLNMLGKIPGDQVHSLAQLCVVYDPQVPGRPYVHGRVHSFRSLLNFKIIKEMPLPYREGVRVMRLLQPCLAIVALDQEDRPTPEKYCVLHRGPADGPDRLEIVYSISEEIRQQQIRQEKTILRHFRKLGCYAFKRVWPGYGASLHYGGTFPMSREEKELTTGLNGLLRGTRSVYIADGSVFPYLPAKGITFTMMANANRIGEAIAKEFESA